MVDVGSLLQKLEKSEKVRAEVEQKLQLLEEKTGEDSVGCAGAFKLLIWHSQCICTNKPYPISLSKQHTVLLCVYV